MTRFRERILAVCADGDFLTLKEIAVRLSDTPISYQTLKMNVSRLVAEGLLSRPYRGEYRLPQPVPSASRPHHRLYERDDSPHAEDLV